MKFGHVTIPHKILLKTQIDDLKWLEISRHGVVGWMPGLDDLRGLFQPM